MPDSQGLYTGEEVRALGLNPDTMVSIGGKYDLGQGGGATGSSFLQNSISSILSTFENLPKYDEVNPFAFDEELARTASKAEYEPYYQELLNDYVSDVERTKSRSSQDLANTLKQLQSGKEYYSGKERRLLDKSIQNTNEGYAGRGLYFSGAKEKDVNDLNTEYNALWGPEGYQTGQYLAAENKAQTGYNRGTEDTDTALSRYQRENTRASQYAVESGVQQRKGEYIQEYETGRKNYYANQIPGGYFTSIYG